MKILLLHFKNKIFNLENGKASLIGLSVFLFTILSSFAASEVEVAFDKKWLNLIRYKKNIFGYKSEVDNKEYFFAKDGKTHPKSELLKTIENFNLSIKNFKDINEHPICKFPGRYLYLKSKNVKINKFNLEECSEFVKYRNKIKLNSVSIIFSSFYINKPASAFGHTLLKLNADDPLKTDLHSYGVDYSAQVTTKNPILYGVLGITGGFYGRFSLMPYFLKMREYNDFESRDLWELELNLTKDEKDLLLAHLWDMNLALFDYYYFTENCSYHVLRIIDAVKPEWHLMDALYSTVIPVDTLVPLMAEKNIIKNYYFRPSLYKRAITKYSKLNENQKKFLNDSISNKELKEWKFKDEQKKLEALDNLIDITDYKFSSDIYLDSKNEKIKDFKRSILLKRSEYQDSTIKMNKFKKEKLDLGHYPRFFGIGKEFKDRNRYNFVSRTALHEILEPDGDIYSNFSLEMNRFEVSFDDDKDELSLDKYEFAHVLALRPLLLIEKKISWEFSVGLKSHPSFQKRISPYLNLGVGPSFKLGSGVGYLFGLGEFEQVFQTRENRFNKLGASFGLIQKYKNFGIHLNYAYLDNLELYGNDIKRVRAESNYNFSKSFELRFLLDKTSQDEVYKALFFYKY